MVFHVYSPVSSVSSVKNHGYVLVMFTFQSPMIDSAFVPKERKKRFVIAGQATPTYTN